MRRDATSGPPGVWVARSRPQSPPPDPHSGAVCNHIYSYGQVEGSMGDRRIQCQNGHGLGVAGNGDLYPCGSESSTVESDHLHLGKESAYLARLKSSTWSRIRFRASVASRPFLGQVLDRPEIPRDGLEPTDILVH